jgi:predicted acetyltransferase
MYFNDQQLIGYIGICSFGGSGTPLEVNGMVHPQYRRQGVFKILSELAIAEWKRRNSSDILLLCDRNSTAGQKFIEKIGAEYKQSECEMYLTQDITKLFES